MTLSRVAGRCPACRGSSLFLGTGGHVTCSRLECPDPTQPDRILCGEEEARVSADLVDPCNTDDNRDLGFPLCHECLGDCADDYGNVCPTCGGEGVILPPGELVAS